MGHAALLCTCLVNLQLFKIKRKNKDIFICESELGTDLNFCAFNTRKKKIQLIILGLFSWVLLLKGVGFL